MNSDLRHILYEIYKITDLCVEETYEFWNKDEEVKYDVYIVLQIWYILTHYSIQSLIPNYYLILFFLFFLYYFYYPKITGYYTVFFCKC